MSHSKNWSSEPPEGQVPATGELEVRLVFKLNQQRNISHFKIDIFFCFPITEAWKLEETGTNGGGRGRITHCLQNQGAHFQFLGTRVEPGTWDPCPQEGKGMRRQLQKQETGERVDPLEKAEAGARV